MPKFKKPRVGVKLDMTPMVDVAFLLLTFFMLTTSFKPPEEVKIVLPDSHSKFKLPESDIMTVTISETGDVYLNVDSQQLRVKLFGEENKLTTQVKVQPEQLDNLFITARVNNPKLRTVIICDKNAEYGTVMDVMDKLQKTQITRFNLVTNLEQN